MTENIDDDLAIEAPIDLTPHAVDVALTLTSAGTTRTFRGRLGIDLHTGHLLALPLPDGEVE